MHNMHLDSYGGPGVSTPIDLSYHGVHYDLSTLKSQEAAITLDELRTKGVKYVRMQWVDLVNNVKCRMMPLPFFEKLLKTTRPGVTLTSGALGFVFFQRAEGFSSVGEHVYAFDLSTLRLCPYAPGHASVFGCFEEKVPKPTLGGQLSLQVDYCPRTILKRAIEEARLSDVEFLVGFETEFFLLKNTTTMEPVNKHAWCSSLALPSGSDATRVIEEIVDNLVESGVEVQSYHSEVSPGQYEVITGPLPTMEAVDVLIHTRETIFNVANKYGLQATFAPRPLSAYNGSASHAHISIHSPKKNKPSSVHPNLSKIESSFLAGLLQNLPGITLFALPTTASYKRMVDGLSTGGTYVCWGTDNREAPIRLCNATSPTSRNFELKCLDGTANPYLAIAAFLSAGMQGISRGIECGMKDCGPEINTTAARMSEAGRRSLGITTRMPLTWLEARQKFVSNELVDSVFGKDFKSKYLMVHESLKEKMLVGTEAERETRWAENY